MFKLVLVFEFVQEIAFDYEIKQSMHSLIRHVFLFTLAHFLSRSPKENM